ncbi:ADP-ribosylation factor GTPase-activating protein 2 [Strongylocentrotus purpuratus]|uniref:Arf-GAP domain-containing protein n=1 Tax=Strongylocentrotus purpuratus TaxID=7668 RepID=A0A7M7PGI9_STRPU|nr:ADP-ribosylation factor GTPase-activating protein 2 [Strongylocentrotus purpuratus]
MAGGPTKSDIQTIFKRLRSIPTNKICFDCNAKNPTWASVTYGVFLCIDCSATHRSLGVHLTFIRSTQLDTSWTWAQLRAMQVGGNANAVAYFRQHGASTNDAQAKYNSRAATLYKSKIKELVAAAIRKYGTELHLEDFVQSPQQKEVDFFEEHVDAPSNITPIPAETSNGTLTSAQELVQKVPVPSASPKPAVEEPAGAPNVEAALSTSPSQVKVEPRKPTIGQRKPASAKKGLGVKKSKGLGAQKVKANFDDIESQALQQDKMREESAKMMELQKTKTKEDEEARTASMRLAYKDMSVEMKKQEDKLKKEDPHKAKQMERLGMGYAGRGGVSHSAMNDMQTIEQVNPVKSGGGGGSRTKSRDFFDEYDSGFSRGSSSSSSRGFKDSSSASFWGDEKDDEKTTDSSWDIIDKSETRQSSYDSIAPLESRTKPPTRKTDYDSGASSSEALKRFANAKSISSDQYHNLDKNSGSDTHEDQQRAAQFANAKSISSDEYFGRTAARGSTGADLGAIKDGMKDGVNQVAGKLSRMANGLVNSIQDHYGY